MSGGTDADDRAELADAVFRVLSHEYRRCVLYYLSERDSVTIEELATVVTGWARAREDDVEVATPDDRREVLADLHHVHLPRIADAGFVRYDHASGEVALTAVPDLLESVLDHSLAQDRREAEGRRIGENGIDADSNTDRDPETDRDRSEDP